MTIENSISTFRELPDSAYVRIPVIAALFACSPATIWRRIKEGSFPKPKKLSAGISAWNVGVVRQELLRVEGGNNDSL